MSLYYYCHMLRMIQLSGLQAEEYYGSNNE